MQLTLWVEDWQGGGQAADGPAELEEDVRGEVGAGARHARLAQVLNLVDEKSHGTRHKTCSILQYRRDNSKYAIFIWMATHKVVAVDALEADAVDAAAAAVAVHARVLAADCVCS